MLETDGGLTRASALGRHAGACGIGPQNFRDTRPAAQTSIVLLVAFLPRGMFESWWWRRCHQLVVDGTTMDGLAIYPESRHDIWPGALSHLHVCQVGD